MTRIHPGALLERPPGPKYSAALDFAELVLPEPMPIARTLRRWREQLPDDITLSLVSPRAAWRSGKGAFRLDDAMKEARDRTREAAEILSARFVVVPTAGAMTTGPRDKALFMEWLSAWGETETLVWQPTGLWDPELAIPFASKLGLIYGFDPLAADLLPTGDLVYARACAVGVRKRFDETRLLDIVDALEQTRAAEAYVAIDSPSSFREACRLGELAA